LLRSIYTTLKCKPRGDVTCRKCNKGTKRALWIAPARRTDPGAVFGPICSKCLSAMNTRSVDESLADLVVYEISIVSPTALDEWQARAAHVLKSDLPAPVELVMDLF
jgi:hypothetical protein